MHSLSALPTTSTLWPPWNGAPPAPRARPEDTASASRAPAPPEAPPSQERHSRTVDGVRLDEKELEQVQELAQRDREVRAHEMAHLAVAGGYAQGGIKLKYATGPDGKRYAVGGEVAIDTAPVPGDPEATLAKARAIRAAAMAPSEPSAQDRRIAIEAARLMAQAQVELLREKTAARGEEDQAASAPTPVWSPERLQRAYQTAPDPAPRLRAQA